jgi:hypothetical protein
MEFKEINNCRICDSKIYEIYNLGDMSLTGIFPETYTENVPTLPLCLAKCDNCELIQLKHDFAVDKLYGDTYGYRSGLNDSMMTHLCDIIKYVKTKVELNNSDTVIDIGSNDGTLLNNYNMENINYIGIDPTAKKYLNFYKNNINVICDFFSEKIFDNIYLKDKKAKIITTISMFYDLPDPLTFVKNIYNLLDDDGVWFSEQSYFLSMIESKSFDTVCQEHIEYYCLKQIKYMCDIVGLKIIDVSFNDTNGGSFCFLTCKQNNNKHTECTELINNILDKEKIFFKQNIIKQFSDEIDVIKRSIFDLFVYAKENNMIIHGYGASTKGNVLLQYFNINNCYLEYINEINEYKYGRYTPGTLIKIISDKESKKMNPSYYFVLPWHFKKNIIKKEIDYIKNGGKLIFPLPIFDIIDETNYQNYI